MSEPTHSRITARIKTFEPFVRFVGECCRFGKIRSIPTTVLHNAFIDWVGINEPTAPTPTIKHVGWALRYMNERYGRNVIRKIVSVDGPCSGCCPKYLGIALK